MRPLIAMISWARLVLSLVRRDYAVQFAGTALGLVWLIVQYLSQIAVFYLIFGVLLTGSGRPGEEVRMMGLPAGADYLAFLLAGMCLWLPLADLILRSCGILAENRALVRRTSVPARTFLWVPVFQALLHYAILFVPIAIVGALRGALQSTFPLAFVLGAAVLLFFAGWGFVLARISVLLKDVTPLLRLVLLLGFWATPIVYGATTGSVRIFRLNPLYAPLNLFRDLLFGLPGGPPFVPGHALPGLVFLVISLILFWLASKRLGRIAADHL